MVLTCAKAEKLEDAQAVVHLSFGVFVPYINTLLRANPLDFLNELLLTHYFLLLYNFQYFFGDKFLDP